MTACDEPVRGSPERETPRAARGRSDASFGRGRRRDWDRRRERSAPAKRVTASGGRDPLVGGGEAAPIPVGGRAGDAGRGRATGARPHLAR